MTTPRVEATMPASGWRLAGFVCAIVLGILGMHVLAMSCSGAEHSAMGTTATARTDISHGGHADAATVADAMPGSEHAGTGDPLSAGQIMALCVALVVSSALVWAALTAGARRRGWTLPRGSALTRAFVLKVHYRPPPSLAQLSVLRC